MVVGTSEKEMAEQLAVRAPIMRRREDILLSVILVFIDALMVGSSFIFAYYLRMSTDIVGVFAVPAPQIYVIMISVLTVTILAVFYVYRLYDLKRGRSKIDEFYKVAAAVSTGTVLSIAINSFILADEFVYSRQILITGWLVSIVTASLARFAYGSLVGRLRKRGFAQQRMIIVGAGDLGQMVLDKVKHAPEYGYRVVGLLDDERTGLVNGVPIVGMIDDLPRLARNLQADEVIIGLEGETHQRILDMISACEDESINIKVCPDAFQIITNNQLGIGDLGGMPLISVRDVGLRGVNRVLKRIVDVVFSAAFLVLFSPVTIVVALAVKLSSPGPAFYVQERVGLDGKPIQVIKFRSMRTDAEEKTGPVWAKAGDPRRTRFGRFIRRFSIDEFPQFINVLVGDMSIVGPRPERPHFVEQFSQTIPRYMRRHREKAGLTGWAQVNGLRGDTPIEERTRYDLYYIENWSLLFDFKIMAKTIIAIFRDNNAY